MVRMTPEMISREAAFRAAGGIGPHARAAYDSAPRLALDAAVREMRNIQQAEWECRSVLGTPGPVVAFDSVEGVYREALRLAGFNVTGVHPSAFQTLYRTHRDRRRAHGGEMTRVMTAAEHKRFEELFPNAARIGTAF